MFCDRKQAVNRHRSAFQTRHHIVVEMKEIPVYHCGCGAGYSLDDPTLAREEVLIARVGVSTELERVRSTTSVSRGKLCRTEDR